MFRAVIIDDEQKGINSLKLLIEKYIPEVKIVSECTSSPVACDIIENYEPDIVFLDINMPHIDGFEVLNNLAYKDFYLVFTTAHQQYALKALKNNAMDYLLKPIDIEDLKKTIEKIKQSIVDKSSLDIKLIINNFTLENRRNLLISDKNGLINISTDEILRIEADSNYSIVFLTSGEQISVSKTLKELEKILCEEGMKFMRVHQSHIVNLEFVVRYVKDDLEQIILKNNESVPVSKAKKANFLKWLGVK